MHQSIVSSRPTSVWMTLRVPVNGGASSSLVSSNAIEPAGAGVAFEESLDGDQHGRDCSLHVGAATSVQHPVTDLGRERR